MDKLSEIMSRCKAGAIVDINRHKIQHLSVYEYIDFFSGPPADEFDSDILKIMVETDTLVCVTFYPHSTAGHYTVYHYDLDKCLDSVIKILNEEC